MRKSIIQMKRPSNLSRTNTVGCESFDEWTENVRSETEDDKKSSRVFVYAFRMFNQTFRKHIGETLQSPTDAMRQTTKHIRTRKARFYTTLTESMSTVGRSQSKKKKTINKNPLFGVQSTISGTPQN